MKCVEVKVFLAPHVGNYFVLATWLLKHVHLSNRPLVNIQPNPFNDLTRQTVRLLSHKLYRSTLQRYEHRLESILVTISNQSSETHCNFSRAHMAPPSDFTAVSVLPSCRTIPRPGVLDKALLLEQEEELQLLSAAKAAAAPWLVAE